MAGAVQAAAVASCRPGFKTKRKEMQTGGEATAAGEGGLMESCENEGVKGEALVSTRPGGSLWKESKLRHNGTPLGAAPTFTP